MKLATTIGDFSGYTNDATEMMAYAKAAGFRMLDYNFCSDYNNKCGMYSEDIAGHLEKVKRKADQLEVTFVQAHSPMGRPIIGGDAGKAFTDATVRSIKACGELGIKNLVVHSGYDKNLSKEETFERNKEFYMGLVDAAENYGVNILVENFNKMVFDDVYWIDNAKDLLDLIEYIDHPLVHACWDAGHGNMKDTPQDESLRILGKHVYALHVQDNFGQDDSHMAPFFGSLNLDSLMHGLFDIGYSGYFTFEAGNILSPARLRRPFASDEKLLQAPLSLRIKAEEFLYEIGKTVLSAYGVFEE